MRRDIIRQSLLVAAVVGTILNLIHQGHAIADVSEFDLGKFLLTYLVPYCVSTFSAVIAARNS